MIKVLIVGLLLDWLKAEGLLLARSRDGRNVFDCKVSMTLEGEVSRVTGTIAGGGGKLVCVSGPWSSWNTFDENVSTSSKLF